MQISRTSQGGETVMSLSTDTELSPAIVAEIKAAGSAAHSVRSVSLG